MFLNLIVLHFGRATVCNLHSLCVANQVRLNDLVCRDSLRDDAATWRDHGHYFPIFVLQVWHVGDARDQVNDGRMAIDAMFVETMKVGEEVDDAGCNGLVFCWHADSRTSVAAHQVARCRRKDITQANSTIDNVFYQ